jgi:tRNA(Ile)-lysidine synthase
MPAARPIRRGSPVRLVRPLLSWSRTAIEALARREGWTWREDASNRSMRYRRNWLRRRVMPELEAAFGPGVVGRIAETADRVRALLDARPTPPRRLLLTALRALPTSERHDLLREALRWWGPQAPRHTAAVEEVEALLEAQPGRRVVWPGLIVWRDRDALVFAEKDEATGEGWPVTVGVPVATPYGTLTLDPLDTVPEPGSASGTTEVADLRALAHPLVLRPWRSGDRFRPLGLDGTKRVSDLLTEAKVPPSERSRRLVLSAGEAIVWVVGLRLAHDARIRPDTAAAVRLRWSPSDP